MTQKSTFLLSSAVTDDSWYRDPSREKDLKKSKDLIKWQTFVHNLFSNLNALNTLALEDGFTLGMNDGEFLWVNLAKLHERYLLCADRITDLCTYGLNLLKTKPASLLKSKSQLIKQGVSQFLSRWIELNKCVDTVIVRREQLKDPSNILQYMKVTDDESHLKWKQFSNIFKIASTQMTDLRR